MKKIINIGLTAFMLFAICACGGKESGEVQISVSCADEAFLEKYKEYDSFVKDEAYAQKWSMLYNSAILSEGSKRAGISLFFLHYPHKPSTGDLSCVNFQHWQCWQL